MAPDSPNDPETSTDWMDAAVRLMGRAGRRGVLRIQGISMIPTFRPGRTIEVEFGTGEVRTGEVLLFRQSGNLVVHRFLARVRSRKAGACLRTRGDGVSKLDPPLKEDAVVGRVVAVERAGGWRSLQGSRARFYAVMAAWHDHFWAAASVAAERLDRRLGKLGMPEILRRMVVPCDRLALRLADRLLFRACHRRVEPSVFPEKAGDV
jgi:hypothetical protein